MTSGWPSGVDGLATLRIANSGPVIPPGEVARLFGPFQRQSTDRTAGANNNNGPVDRQRGS